MKKTILTLGILAAYGVSQAATPVHRPLIEEYTGLWCEWCTRGFVAMELIEEKYGNDQVTISYHQNDAMAVTNTFPVSFLGVPVATIDRQDLIDPYYGKKEPQDFAITEEIEKAMAVPTNVAIDVVAELDGSKVIATSTACFTEDIDKANYQIGYILIGNNLSNNKWLQANGYDQYRDKPTFKGTHLEVLTTWGSYVRGLVFNDVVIDASAMMGVNNSLPAYLVADEEYTHSYTFNIGSNPLVNDPQDLGVAVFVVNKNTKRVVNANKFFFKPRNAEGTGNEEENGILDVELEAGVAGVEYYNLAGQKVSDPVPGVFIRVETLENGMRRSEKVLIPNQ